MQSQVTKERNLEETAGKVISKLDTAPETITSEDASLLHSREARVMGGPTKGDLASQAQSVAAANEQGATVQTNPPQSSATNAKLTPAEQSHRDRVRNFYEVAERIAAKMATQPEKLIRTEADLLHSKELKAFGTTEKGASQAKPRARQRRMLVTHFESW